MYHLVMKGLLSVAAGFAADHQGNGVVYARVGERPGAPFLRIQFTVKRYPALLEREIGYAALTALCAALRRRGVERVRLNLDDERLIGDLREHREVPAPLTLAYVRLGCALNQFASYEISGPSAGESDLTARARTEVSMHAAA
jgi:hypothetical protein